MSNEIFEQDVQKRNRNDDHHRATITSQNSETTSLKYDFDK